jgi:hypothetical protein
MQRMTDPSNIASGAAEPLAESVSSRTRPVPLRQMGIGELLDAAFRVYRMHWAALVGIVALVVIPVTFLQFWVTEVALGPADQFLRPSESLNRLLTVTLGFFALQFLIVQPFLVAAVARASADGYLGEPVSIGSTYRYALSRLPAILWITILSSLATLVGFILLVIPGILLLVRLSFAPAALVVEGRRGRTALRRSWRLTAGQFWRIAITLFVAGVITTIVETILAVPGQVAAQAVGPGAWPLQALSNALATVVITPFGMLVIVLLYFDQRIRKEGFDIEVMAREFASTS